MFKNLFRHSYRALNRQKGYLLINITGLSIGIACSMIITLFIIHELNYDQFNEKKERIYRLVLNGKIGGQEVTVSSTAAPIGPTMLREFPEVENFVRINTWGETILKNNDQSFTETGFMEADSSIFDIFTLPVLKGNKKTFLNAPHKLVLTESTAKKIFGIADALNKMIKVGSDTALYKVTGIIADIPESSHFKANVIGSFVTNTRANNPTWLSNSFNTYLLLKPNTNPKDVDSRIPEMLSKNIGPELQKYLGQSLEDFIAKGNKYNMYLQRLTDIHLNPTVQHDMKPSGDPKYLKIFGCVALLIIIIAAINFMNLSTAQASKRAKEVGMKKVCGSSRAILVTQFITESVLLSFISLLVAIFVVELSLPYFNNLFEAKLDVHYFNNLSTIPALIVLSVFIGFLSGSYPAFYLSSFNPYVVLKGKLKNSMKNGQLRSVLVVLQFTISIILIVGTIIMFRQIQFMINKDPGFNKDQLMVIPRAGAIGKKIKAFKEEIMRIQGVVKISASTAVPGHNNNNNGYMIEGRLNESFLLITNWVDYDYFDTYGIKLSEGRVFNESFSTDSSACIINESAVVKFNLSKPLETRFKSGADKPEDNVPIPVLGVTKNFHHESLHSEINPYLFLFKKPQNNWGYISVKLSPHNISNTIKNIEKVWKEFTSNDPLQYFFMDEDFAKMYKEEKQNAQLSVLFTILAILIASLGLFGLTSFTIEQRIKEIGVRRALGASVTSIFYLISKEIIVLVSISTIIAWPLIYYIARNWLQNYYYRISLNPFDFLIGFIIAISIALATISYRTIKSARVNPAESLRYE
jgi:putative ABC transport system permease protein